MLRATKQQGAEVALRPLLRPPTQRPAGASLPRPGRSLYEKSATSWLKTLALTAATPPKTVSATIDGFTLVR